MERIIKLNVRNRRLLTVTSRRWRSPAGVEVENREIKEQGVRKEGAWGGRQKMWNDG